MEERLSVNRLVSTMLVEKTVCGNEGICLQSDVDDRVGVRVYTSE